MGFWSAGTMPREVARDKPRACLWAGEGVEGSIDRRCVILSRQLGAQGDLCA